MRRGVTWVQMPYQHGQYFKELRFHFYLLKDTFVFTENVLCTNGNLPGRGVHSKTLAFVVFWNPGP